MTPRRLIASLFIALMLAAVVPGSASKDNWINLTTKNFNIVSNASEDDTREVGQKLEQFRFVFSLIFNTKAADSVPVTVMVFKSDAAFTPFKPLYNGKPANLAGYFQPGRDENVIALNLEGRRLNPMATIFHEYTHLLTSFSPRQWPLWLKEGIAELYSTFDVKKNSVTLGAPVSNHVFLLRDNRMMPLQTLFSVAHGSPEYNEKSKQGVFYAQSWALAHYLMYGDASVRQPQLIKFLNMLMSGAEVQKAFEEAFKTDYVSMEKELRKYVGRDTYSATTYTLKSTQTAGAEKARTLSEYETDVTVRPLSEAEVQFYLGNLLFRTRRQQESEAWFKKAAELDPQLARPYEGLGFLAMDRDKHVEASEHFKQAVSRGSKNHLAHYYYAAALYRQASETSLRGEIDPEQMRLMVEALQTSIKLMPAFPYSYELFASVRSASGGNLEEAVQLMRQAMQIEPQNKRFVISLARIQMQKRDFAAAKKTLEPLAASEEDSYEKQTAASLINTIGSFGTSPRASSLIERPEESQGEPRDAPTLIRKTEEGKSEVTPAPTEHTELPRGAPSMKLDGAQSIGGVLAMIECNNGMVLVVRTADKVLRFHVSDIAKLQFFSQDPEFRGNIGCGAMNLKAFIYFKPVSGQTSFAGDAVAVEFAK